VVGGGRDAGRNEVEGASRRRGLHRLGRVGSVHVPSMAGERLACAKNGVVTDAPQGKVRRSTSWAGLRAGDPVSIDDARARRGSFEFVAFVEHLENGQSWVEVVGGKRGDRKLWSFRPEQVFRPGAKGQGLSLAEEPGLPF